MTGTPTRMIRGCGEEGERGSSADSDIVAPYDDKCAWKDGWVTFNIVLGSHVRADVADDATQTRIRAAQH